MDVIGSETGSGGLSAFESGTVHAAAWAGFNDCSIVPQHVSHPPPKREDNTAKVRLARFRLEVGHETGDPTFESN